GNKLSVTQFLEIAGRAGHVSDIVVVCDRAKKRIELQIECSIGGDRVELVEQHYELAPVAAKILEHRAQRIERRLKLRKRFVAHLFGNQSEQLLEKLGKREPALLLKVDERENVR